MQGGGLADLSKKTQEAFALPDKLKLASPFPFGGMNQSASRLAIPDQEAFWIENYIKLGDGTLRTAWDVGDPLYTAASDRRLVCAYSYNIGPREYFIVFLDNGTAYQVEYPNGAITPISTDPLTFYTGSGSFPATVSWAALYLLIANRNTPNDYWAWDGSLLYTGGTISPQITITSAGAGYVSDPTITVFGGHGSGVTLVPTITAGSVVDVTVTNPGNSYLPGDVVQAIFSGGGSDNGAMLNASLTGAALTSIVVVDGGTGYVTPPAVTFLGGSGSGAAATAVVSGGVVVSVTLDNGGSGYTSKPAISFGGPGTGAAASAVLPGQPVAGVNVIDGGTNYHGVPALALVGGGGSGATAQALMSGPGPISQIEITDPGVGYSSLPTITIADSGGGTGTGATALVTSVVSGQIRAVSITNPGVGYTAPTAVFSGGGASSTATAAAFAEGGTITAVRLLTPGQGYNDAPAVIVQSGQNNAASATLQLMPFGISGDSLETYSSQVWVQNPFQPGSQSTGGVRNSSAPGSISDFSTSAGGLTENNSDRFLHVRYVAIRQSNGYLYPFGDSSVNVISNVQVQGNPATKSLNNQNTDPQTGTNWRDTLQDFSRTILFTNPFGVYGLFGGAVQKLSAKIDRVFTNAVFPSGANPPLTGAIQPSAAVCNFQSQKLYLQLMTITDPFVGGARNAMVAWNEREWFIVSQTVDLRFITTQEIDSTLIAWGTDGQKLCPLLNRPSENLTKIYASKLWGSQLPFITKLERVVYVQAENFADENSAPRFDLEINTEFANFSANTPQIAFPSAGYVTPANASPPEGSFPLLMARTGDIAAEEVGFTLRSTNADHALYNALFAYEDLSALFG